MTEVSTTIGTRSVVVGNSPSSIRFEECTAALRFIERDGKRILQQMWTYSTPGNATGGHEWRDVPFWPNDVD